MQSKLFFLLGLLTVHVAHAEKAATTNTPSAIPWDQIGARAGADYQGNGLTVAPSGSGARLHCLFQRLEGEATARGLWLTSTVTNTASDRFRVTALEVSRQADSPFNVQVPAGGVPLAAAGKVSIAGQTVSFSRPALREEYSVSMDGVRQDFIVAQAPGCSLAGELVVKLGVSGARVEPAVYGAQLVLEHSGRCIAYSRLRATDATGKELPARIEVQDSSAFSLQPSAFALSVVVVDAGAVYPVRIDPTFSDANWVSTGGVPGTDGVVRAAVVDGSGNLYIGGSFEVAGSAVANNIARWNGTGWSALGSGMNNPVWALAVSGGTLYAGGAFTTAGGKAANRIAQWDGSGWSALGSGMNDWVWALAVSGGTLYAGGGFTTAGGNAANYIAQWNGSGWLALGSGLNSFVNALAVSEGTLYAGGNFTNAGGNAANYIAQWNGSSWSALGSGVNLGVAALAVSGGMLYAGGYFTTAGDNAANRIAQWNGSDWSALGSGMNNDVAALAVLGGTLYAGGDFTMVSSNAANYVAQWNGSDWSALGSGMNFAVQALAVSGGTLYVAGSFTTVGGNAASYIAQWNGSGWSSLGSGMNGEVVALAVWGGTLYAGGYFTTAGGNAANCIAQWNGSNWSGLGLGMGVGDGYPGVNVLAVSGGTLYAGGYFTTAGGNAANYIAQWNGSNWSALGSGMDSLVSALAVSGGTLYAGGYFRNAGSNAANHIAQWNGSSWSALGSGINSYVYALAVLDGTLYAGGDFTTAGGNAANYIAQWNGSGWSCLGSGMGGGDGYPSVNALAVSGGTLYAGGDFTTAGGNTANYIAQWNGSAWSALGSGMGGAYPSVSALAISGGTLYAGGSFTTVGGKVSAYAAETSLPGLPACVTFTATPIVGSVPLTVYFTSASEDSAGNTITNWNWDFGDGSTSGLQNPPHTYTNVGTFSPTLIATNSLGNTVIGSGPEVISVNAFLPSAISVTLSPSVAAGARWQVDGGPWQNSGAIVTNLPAGNHTISFNVVNGWLSPDSQLVALTAGQITILTATYTPQAPVFLAGSYNGLFFIPGNVTQTNSGFVTLKTTAGRGFSGKLLMNGGAYPFSGQMPPDGIARVPVKRGKFSPLTLGLQMLGADVVIGEVINAHAEAAWAAPLLAERAGYATNQGRYTMVMLGSNGVSSLPTGCGYATVTVSKSGMINLAARLADGSKASQSVPESNDGHCPLYAPLDGGKGSILSWIGFTNATGELAGELSWCKPAIKTADSPDELSWPTAALGARYNLPGKGTNVFGETNSVVSVVLSGGNLSTNLSDAFVVNADSRARPVDTADQPSLTITPSTGVFSGSRFLPGTRKTITYHGILLQNQTNGYGYFLGTNQSGQVELEMLATGAD